MKKTILAMTLPALLCGLSISYAESRNFKDFEQSYLKATSTLVSKYAAISSGEAAYAVELEDINDKVTLKDSFVFSQNNNGVTVKYEVNSIGDVDLTKYNSTDGQAVITGELRGDANINSPQLGGLIVLKNIFSKAKSNVLFDEKLKILTAKINIADNTIPVLVGDDTVAEVILSDLNSDSTVGLNKDYSELLSFTSKSTGKNICFKTVGSLAEQMKVSGSVGAFSSSSNFVAKPLKIDAKGSIASIDINSSATTKDQSFAAAVKDVVVNYLFEDTNGLIAGNINYNIGNFSLAKDKLPALDFGSFSWAANVKGIKNLENWQELLKKMHELQSKDSTVLSEEEVKELQALFAPLLTKDSRIETEIENKLSDKDQFKLSMAFQPTEAFVKLVQSGPEAYKKAMISKSPDVLINEFIQEIKLTGTVTEDLIIAQYKNILTLDGKDTSQAENEVKGGAQMVMMLVAMQTGKLGISPIKSENGRYSVDIVFKDGKWTINGKVLTTAEIFAAFQ